MATKPADEKDTKKATEDSKPEEGTVVQGTVEQGGAPLEQGTQLSGFLPPTGNQKPLEAQLDISQLTPEQLEALRTALFPQSGQLVEAQPLQAWPPAPVSETAEATHVVHKTGTITATWK